MVGEVVLEYDGLEYSSVERVQWRKNDLVNHKFITFIAETRANKATDGWPFERPWLLTVNADVGVFPAVVFVAELFDHIN